MKTDRVAITKGNYKENILKRAIIICWVLLAICFIVKLCGGNFFAIACHNEKFVDICNYFDNSVFKYILYYCSFIFTSCMEYLIIYYQSKFKKKYNVIIFIMLCSLFWIIKVLYELNIFNINGWLFDIISLSYLYICLILCTRKYVFSALIIILDTVLLTISSIIKNISFDNTITNSFLITTIFLIDYYIMLILCTLYSKRIMLKNNKKEE